jgi:undecaprenyl pyrophosphate synthase
MVVAIDSLEHGWVKWDDQKPIEQRMGLLIEGFETPPRSELGDTVKENWPVDDNGQQNDPWVRTVHVVMRDRTKLDDDDDGLFTFVTSSYGGRQTISELCKQAAKHPDQNPIIRLEKSSYTQKKTARRVLTPVLKVIGWMQK